MSSPPQPPSPSDQALAHAARAFQRGDLRGAEQACLALLQAAPRHFDAHQILAAIRHNQGRLGEALTLYEQALAIKPDHPETHTNQGNALHALGRHAEALACYDRALALRPVYWEAHYNRGTVLQALRRETEALAAYDSAIAANPRSVEAHNNRGNVLQALRRYDEALASYDRALSLNPTLPEAHSNRGGAFQGTGRHAEALACFTRALELRPHYVEAHSNLIFTGDFAVGYGFAEHQAERRRWWERHGAKLAAAAKPHANTPDPERRLRLGYVSADFKRHSAAYCFGPVLRRHDRERFEVVCYAGGTTVDDFTREFHGLASLWRPISGLSDEALAERIRADGIDILVDLSGHSAGNRLPVFARKPAPVQITAWGHATGTGLPTIDALFADKVSIPEEARGLFAETIHDLPCIIGFEAPSYAPEVGPLPSSTGAPFTFGCLNRLSKVTDPVLALWAKILAAVPGSRLLLKDRSLSDEAVRKHFTGRALAHGIASERLVLQGGTPHVAHLAAYSQVDIALDPFPQNGGISTYEALWMGVPVLARAGNGVPSRISAAILSAVGLTDWIAAEEADYLAAAVSQARAGEKLARLRAELRARIAASKAGDPAAYTAAVEAAYRALWKKWCARTPAPKPPLPEIQLAASLFRQGQRADALSILRQAASATDAGTDKLLALGEALNALSAPQQAIAAFERVLALQPDHADAHARRAGALHALGRHDEAVAGYQKAIALRPDDWEAHYNCGTVLQVMGRPEEALRHHDRATALNPRNPNTHNNRGSALQALKRPAEALACFDQALSLNPDHAEAHGNRGQALQQLERPDEALVSFERAVALRPERPEGHNSRGDALIALGRYLDALASFEHALKLRPDYVEAHNNRGRVLQILGRNEPAIASFDRAIALRPDGIEAHSNRGAALEALGRFEEALASYERALAINPRIAETLNNRGNVLREFGRLDEALTCFRQALEIKPELWRAHCNMIFTADFALGYGFREHQAERRRWWERHGAKLAAAAKPHANTPDPERRLRLGYVSADFKRHSAAYCFGPVLRRHDRERFEVVCYAGGTTVDDFTREFHGLASLWRPISGLSDEALAERIRADGIDILVDLSGHSAGNRLPVFARKPAPVQITAWGHATGTGLPTIDALFAGKVAVPKEVRKLFAETIHDLPCIIGFEAPTYAPDVGPLPSSTGAPFTFGCLNKLSKITDPVLALWSKILAAVPGSRLLLKDRALSDEAVQKRFAARAAAHGIAADRLVLLGATPHPAHLAAFGQVDIALDPFPQNGGISTYEALWMGVPVLARAGNSVPSRVSAAILHALGLKDWVVDNDREYVKAAARHAKGRSKLATLRAGLRARVATSPAGDPLQYTKAVETAYRTLWKRWCGRRS